VVALEQELSVSRRQLKKQAASESTLNVEVLQELETLEARYRKSDEDLRSENAQLRKQSNLLAKQLKETAQQLQSAKQTIEVRHFEQFAQLKRLEDTLKQIRAEGKHSYRLLESHLQAAQPERPVSAVAPSQDAQLRRELEMAQHEIEVL
jgi:chromosome segregation ATPase